MSPELLEKVKGFCTEEGIEYRDYPEYSGRFMYGKKTAGIMVNRHDYSEVMGAFDGLNSDNMGLDYIIY
jgi:hypothetical protein